MRPGPCARHGLAYLSAIGLLALSACQTREPEPIPPPASPAAAPPSPTVRSEPLRDEIPSSELTAVMAAHYKGLGFMEQYKYGEAVEALREVIVAVAGVETGRQLAALFVEVRRQFRSPVRLFLVEHGQCLRWRRVSD